VPVRARISKSCVPLGVSVLARPAIATRVCMCACMHACVCVCDGACAQIKDMLERAMDTSNDLALDQYTQFWSSVGSGAGSRFMVALISQLTALRGGDAKARARAGGDTVEVRACGALRACVCMCFVCVCVCVLCAFACMCVFVYFRIRGCAMCVHLCAHV
jgi:hypothetical protein